VKSWLVSFIFKSFAELAQRFDTERASKSAAILLSPCSSAQRATQRAKFVRVEDRSASSNAQISVKRRMRNASDLRAALRTFPAKRRSFPGIAETPDTPEPVQHVAMNAACVFHVLLCLGCSCAERGSRKWNRRRGERMKGAVEFIAALPD
jgi:hypothetical protein